MEAIKLYRISATGAIQIWVISSIDNTICIYYGTIDGAIQKKIEVISQGKAGRTLEEQIISRINSRVNKQLDKGYCKSIEEARKCIGKNSLQMFRPMLAVNLHKINNMNWHNAFVQYKFDGHRCLITKINNKIIAYSRRGKIINTIDHIINDLDIPEGVTLDGELYCHGQSLQTLTSWIKKEQEDTLKLNYIVYDTINPSPYEYRFELLNKLELNLGSRTIIASTIQINKADKIPSLFYNAKNIGYEGLIVRQDNVGYGIGKKSTSLVKIKQLPGFELNEEEFLVIDIIPSKDNWGILICKALNGKPFRMSAPGTMQQKVKILENKDKYIGKYITAEYPQLTDEGIPFHCVALRFREDI